MAERVWTSADALAWTADYLERTGDEHPRRSAEWLLSAATGLSRVELYAQHDRPLSPEERARYRSLIERRAEGMPLQYVTGEMPFRHLVIHVEPGVFIPRPETEVLVDVVLEALGAGCSGGLRSVAPETALNPPEHPEPAPEGGSTVPSETALDSLLGPEPAAEDEPIVVDLCTGSGCVAASVAYECSGGVVYATDVDERAVEAARRNALHANVQDRVQVLHGDLFSPLPADIEGRVDAVVANPPYIPSGDVPGLPREILAYEPPAALDGGPDGLDVARRIMEEATRWLRPGGTLAIELDAGRVAQAAEEMASNYTGVAVRRDLVGRDRIVVGRTQEANRP